MHHLSAGCNNAASNLDISILVIVGVQPQLAVSIFKLIVYKNSFIMSAFVHIFLILHIGMFVPVKCLTNTDFR